MSVIFKTFWFYIERKTLHCKNRLLFIYAYTYLQLITHPFDQACFTKMKIKTLQLYSPANDFTELTLVFYKKRLLPGTSGGKLHIYIPNPHKTKQVPAA